MDPVELRGRLTLGAGDKWVYTYILEPNLGWISSGVACVYERRT